MNKTSFQSYKFLFAECHLEVQTLNNVSYPLHAPSKKLIPRSYRKAEYYYTSLSALYLHFHV